MTAAVDARFAREAAPMAGRLLPAAMRLTGNRQDAEDLVQETMLLAYRGFGTFREGTNLTAWLRRIMHNTWINECRRRRRRLAEVPLDDVTDREYISGSTEKAVLAAMPDENVRAALMTLRSEVRTAVYYADVEGYSYREIAEAMNCSIGTVMSRLHRGRRRLRAALGLVARERGYIDDGPESSLTLIAG
jgi:RNA polymerase sigma-70 factor, ECF subfamily